jgi:hypothetical protein
MTSLKRRFQLAPLHNSTCEGWDLIITIIIFKTKFAPRPSHLPWKTQCQCEVSRRSVCARDASSYSERVFPMWFRPPWPSHSPVKSSFFQCQPAACGDKCVTAGNTWGAREENNEEEEVEQTRAAGLTARSKRQILWHAGWVMRFTFSLPARTE